jgi:hypothetical protein
MELDSEARVERALDHPLAVHFEDRGRKPPINACLCRGSAPAFDANTRLQPASMVRATTI